MALPTWYDTGTVSVGDGSTTVSGTGTLWGGDAIMAGDLFVVPSQPLVPPVIIASVTDDGELELLWPWPGDPVEDEPYVIRYAGIIERSTAQSRRVLEELGIVKANGRGLFYLFDENVADADPGRGRLRLNDADPSAATALYIDDLDANGALVAPELDTWDDSTSPLKGRLWLRRVSNPAAFRSFSVTGAVVDGMGYRKLTLEPVGGSGAFPADDPLMVFFTPKGDQGAGYEYSAEVADQTGLEAFEDEDPGYRVWVDDLGGDFAGRSGVVELLEGGDWAIAAVFTGERGAQGWRGWVQVFGIVPDGERRVEILIGYFGGEGPPPTAGIGWYRGATGLVEDIGDAVNIRGPIGPAGDIDGVTPFWQLLITEDVDGAAARLALGIPDKADQATAEAGADDDDFMTALKVKQAIDALTTPFDPSELYTNVSVLALMVAGFEGTVVGFSGMIADSFEDESGVDVPLQLSGATGTNIGDMTAGGGLAAAFDGNTNQAMTASAHRAAVNGFVGKSYSGGRRIDRVVATAANNNGFGGSLGHNVSLTLYGKNGAAPSSGTDGTSLGTTGTITVAASQAVTISSSDKATLFDHVWVYVVNVSGSAFVAVAEAVFSEAGTSENQVYDPVNGLYRPSVSGGATSYTNPGGSGNRTSTITVTSTFTTGGGSLSGLVDGSFSNNYYWSAQSAAGKYLRFDFGSGNARYIDEFKFYQADASGHGTFKIRASNDLSTWFDSNTFTLGGSTTQTQAITGIAGAYRYWQIEGVSGNTSNPYMHEFEFKISSSAPSINNMTLVSIGYPSQVQPDKARLVLQIETPLAVEPGVDFSGEVSRDGINWVAANDLALVASIGDIKTYASGAIDLSGQPAGSLMHWRGKTLTNKDIAMTGVVENWG